MNYDGTRICAVPDAALAAAAANLCRWPTGKITWAVTGTVPGLSADQITEAFGLAWQYWADVANITPTFTTNARTAMVVMGSGRIDGPNGTLAWSELPCGNPRQLTQKYDTSERWIIADQPSGGLDIVRVACHEIGHVIGIPHIGNGNLMQPTYSSSIRRPQVGDIAEAVARYGRRATPAPIPTPPPAPVPIPPRGGNMSAILAAIRSFLPVAKQFAALTPNTTDDAIVVALESLLDLIDRLRSGAITREQFVATTDHLKQAA